MKTMSSVGWWRTECGLPVLLVSLLLFTPFTGAAAVHSASTTTTTSTATAAQTAAKSRSTPITVIGVHSNVDEWTGQRPSRKEITSFSQTGGPEWDLYLLALSAFQAVDESDELSYFRIAGIHGLPHSAWNGVDQVPGGSDSGYCPHGELIFSTWHRPFVALFEQVLVSHAVDIASKYPPGQVTVYQEAARNLRLPYWDWALDSRLPVAVTTVNVTVISPDGDVTIPNPLYSYQFRQGPAESGNPDMAKYANTETTRCPGSDGSLTNVTASNFELESVAEQLTSDVYRLFTGLTKANDWIYKSFELPHNSIHMSAGCNGTLRPIEVSAFEPLFMLHHCNVDRLIAMWQAIYYQDKMFNTTDVSKGQLGTPNGTIITADSPLKPFFASVPPQDSDNANITAYLHTSNSVTNIRTFGYTYPEIDDWSPWSSSTSKTAEEELAKRVRGTVNALYGWERRGGPAVNSAVVVNQDNATSPRPTNYFYTAQIQVDRAELPLPATIELIVGDSTSNQTKKMKQDGGDYDSDGGQRDIVVGRMSLLSMPMTGIATVSLPLTGQQRMMDMFQRIISPSSSLYESLDSKRRSWSRKIPRDNTTTTTTSSKPPFKNTTLTGPNTVVPLLKRNLRVEIRGGDGNLVPLSAIPSFNLEIQGIEYTHSPKTTAGADGGEQDDAFPNFGKVSRWPVVSSAR